jgi:putative Mg2+ transporter-C (MgtC) family protein
MPTTLTWQEIAIRLLLTIACSGAIGFDRDERGRSAGFRTNLLVGLAACVAMIQANLLMNSRGKASDSFIVLDLMRLPLGILSGIGFIGAGTILKRGDLIVGVTTAATIWFVTVMGLCFGGGQIGLGVAAFALGLAILLGLRRFEMRMPRQHSGTLRIRISASGLSQVEIASLLTGAGISLTEPSLSSESAPDGSRVIGWKLRWKGRHDEVNLPPAIQELAAHPEVQSLEFTS